MSDTWLYPTNPAYLNLPLLDNDLLTGFLTRLCNKDFTPTGTSPAPLPEVTPAPLVCTLLNTQIGPEFTLRFRRHLIVGLLPELAIGTEQGIPIDPLTLACLPVNAGIYLSMGLLLDQTWQLQQLLVGDLASTIALAPGEKLTLEFQQSQRRVFSQTEVRQVENMSSLESTTMDKDATAVTNTASMTENWHVDADGSYGIGHFHIGASGGWSKNVTHTSQNTTDHVHESTKKAAKTLKTLHKIEVKGVTETYVENRMTRVITNPYQDRTLSINVFELEKQFVVQTGVDSTTLELLIPLANIKFSPSFVARYRDFLASNIIDPGILQDLASAIDAAEVPPLPTLSLAQQVAEVALRYLFLAPLKSGPNIFNMQLWTAIWRFPLKSEFPLFGEDAGDPTATAAGPGKYAGIQIPLLDPNDPSNSFDGTLMSSEFASTVSSGSADIQQAFVELNLLYALYNEIQGILARNETPPITVLDLAIIILKDVGSHWNALTAAEKDLSKFIDNQSLGEVFRRFPGVLALLTYVLQPLLDQASDDLKELTNQMVNKRALDRLLNHLNCNANYYLQRFLSYEDSLTNHQAIVDFAEQALARLANALPGAEECIYALFDPHRAYVDQQQVVLPAIDILSPTDIDSIGSLLGGQEASPFQPAEVLPRQDSVLVPSDGIHLEAVAGVCVLDNPPPPVANPSLELSLQGADIKVGGA